jgi:hypothetical protein
LISIGENGSSRSFSENIIGAMKVFLLVADRCVLPLEISPTSNTDELRDDLIQSHGLPSGKYHFVHNGRFLGGDRPFSSLPPYSRVVVIIQVPEDDSRYHWPPTPSYISSLQIDSEEATFGNLHLPELYSDAHSIWRNAAAAGRVIDLLRTWPSLIVHYSNFMRNHQSIIAAMPGHNRYFPLEILGFTQKPQAGASDAEIAIFELPKAQRAACARLTAMGFPPERVLQVMKRCAFDDVKAMAALIKRA